MQSVSKNALREEPEDQGILDLISLSARLKHSRTANRLGNAAAWASLLCSASLWIAFPIGYIPVFAGLQHATAFDFFRIMAAGVVLAGIAAVCRVKLWRVAVPVAIVMFFFVMYVMGS